MIPSLEGVPLSVSHFCCGYFIYLSSRIWRRKRNKLNFLVHHPELKHCNFISYFIFLYINQKKVLLFVLSIHSFSSRHVPKGIDL